MKDVSRNTIAIFLVLVSISIGCATSIEDYLKENSMTFIQNVNIIDFEKNKYIVSIYSVDLQELDVEKRIELMKTAVIKSESNLSTFINDSEILHQEKLTSQRIITNNAIDTSEEYVEIIKERSNGILKKFLKLDFKNNNMYTVIRYLPL